MTRRAKLWQVAAALFTLGNLLGAGWAAMEREPLHAAAHVGLTLLGAYLVWRLATPAATPEMPSVPRAQERLELLQHSVDAVAIEVERIGEAQRFNAKLQAEQAEPRR